MSHITRYHTYSSEMRNRILTSVKPVI